MKVLCQVRLMLLLLFMINGNHSRGGSYAIEAVRQKQHQSIPEVSFKQETLKFGTKILRVPVKTADTLDGAVENQNTINKTASTSTSYRKSTTLALTNSNMQQQQQQQQQQQREVFEQIPVVYKNYTISARNSNAAQRQRGHTNYTTRRENIQTKPTRSSGALARTKANYMKSDGKKITKPIIITTTTTTTTTAPTTTTTTTPQPRFIENFPLGNAFNFFNLWNLSNPQFQGTSTTKKPPKKYVPPQITVQSSKVEKTASKLPKNGVKTNKFKEVLITPKPNYRTTTSFHTTTSATTTRRPTPRITPTVTTTTTTVRTPPSTPKIMKTTTPKVLAEEGPFRIALSTFNFSNPLLRKDVLIDDKDKGKRAIIGNDGPRKRFNCPRESEVRFQLFPKICEVDKDCGVWQKDELCCEIFGAKSCVNGVAKPLEEYSHAQRRCPSRPLAELWWEVKECQSDMDCWPRVCCPDGRRRYCRTSQPQLETAPVQVKRSFNYLSEYLECTPPPPPIFDLHPKACTSTFDCFPNVCCQEAGLRHCRPPKKSLLTWMANIFNVDFVKRFTQNIVIK